MLEDKIRDLLAAVLQVPGLRVSLGPDSPLLGAFPEFDSMAVVSVITSIEETFGIVIDDDEVDASTFETVRTLARFVEGKIEH